MSGITVVSTVTRLVGLGQLWFLPDLFFARSLGHNDLQYSVIANHLLQISHEIYTQNLEV